MPEFSNDRNKISEFIASDEKYTPYSFMKVIHEALVKCFGLPTIHFDPASCSEANKNIRALKYRTLSDEFFAPWDEEQVVWVNPPYSRDKIKLFAKKIHEESMRQKLIVSLVTSDSSTGWFPILLKNAHGNIGLKRIRFQDTDASFIKPNALILHPGLMFTLEEKNSILNHFIDVLHENEMIRCVQQTYWTP